MKLPTRPENGSSTIAEALRKRLKETERSSQDLAESVELPTAYIDDLIAGRRRPPLPSRTDLYEKMTSYLGFSRNDLATIATAEREASAPAKPLSPKPAVKRELLALCEPETAEKLGQRGERARLAGYIQRLLEITQTSVRRMLDDKMTLRLAAKSSVETYAAMRLEVLEFLDTSPDMLTMEHLNKFLQPRVQRWDVDLETNVLRVVMHSQVPGDRSTR